MKLVTYRRGREERGGIVVADRILDLLAGLAWAEKDSHRTPGEEAAAERYGTGVLGFVRNADHVRPVADALVERAIAGGLPETLFVPLAGADLLAPIPRPPSMRDGYAFRQHVEAARRNRGVPMIEEFDLFPVFYFTNHQAVVGGGELAVRPMQRERLDYELEGAIVVGKQGRDLTVQNADEHVFGYLIMNDWSARAVQMEEMKLSLGPAKGKDFATGLGPYLVTRDELSDRRIATPVGEKYDLAMKAWVNDIQLSTGNLKDMTWTFAQILERVSYGVSVYPGDVIGSGTVGTGCLLELNGSKITNNQWLQAGDRVVCEIERLGRLENVIRALDLSFRLRRAALACGRQDACGGPISPAAGQFRLRRALVHGLRRCPPGVIRLRRARRFGVVAGRVGAGTCLRAGGRTPQLAGFSLTRKTLTQTSRAPRPPVLGMSPPRHGPTEIGSLCTERGDV